MKYLITLFYLLSIQLCFSQEDKKTTDSIQALIITASSDSTKIEQQISLALYLSKSNANKADKLLYNALKTLQSNDYSFDNKNHKTAEVYDILGIIERRRTNYVKSLEYYLKALKLKELQNDSINLGRSYHNIATLFNSQKKYSKAEVYMQKAMALRFKYNDSVKYAKSVNLYGYIKYKLNDVDSALFYYNKAKRFFNTNYRVADVNRKIAFIHIDNLEYNKALTVYEENLNLFTNNNLIERKGRTLLKLAHVYIKLKQYNKAILSLNKAEKIALLTQDKDLLFNIFFSRYQIELNKKKYKSALKHYQTYRKIKDTVYNIKKSNKIKELELDYIYKKEKLTDSLSFAHKEETLIKEVATEKKQKNLYTLLFITCLLALASLFLLYHYKQKLNHESRLKDELKFKLLNNRLENINRYVKQLEVDNKMRFHFKEELLNKIKTIKSKSTINDLKTYKSLIIDLQSQIDTEKRLDNFNDNSNEKNHQLGRVLSEQFPALTKTELEICDLITLNLSNKEIMNIRNSSLASVKSSRYRIRKKMNIPKGIEIGNFIKNL